MTQFQKDIEEDSESSDEDKENDDKMDSSQRDLKQPKKERKIQLVRLKSILSKIKEKDQTQNPIRKGALMELKKDIMRRIPSFQLSHFSKPFYRFFSKHVHFFPFKKKKIIKTG